MTNFYQVSDNSYTTAIAGTLNNTTTPLVLNGINTTRFDAVTNGYIVTIWDSTTYPDPTNDPNMEKAVVTAATIGVSGSLTITRANPVAHTGEPRIALLNVSDITEQIQTAVNTVETTLASHASNVNNPHSVTKSQVGLGNVDNTSDASKPVSTAQAAADALKVSKAGDTMTGDLTLDGSAGQRDLTLTSTGAGGYDGVNNEANTGAYYDSTSRINLESYQPHFNSYGETIRNYLKDPRAKAMLTYLADWDTPHYTTSDYTWTTVQAGSKTICWIGAHFLNNDDPNNFDANLQHGHFNIEVPDSAGALRTRFEIKLIDETTGKFGVETTSIRTNKAHFEFQIASGDEKFRLVGSTLRNKDIEFNQDVRGGNPCFTLRGGAATSGDFEVHRFSGSPRTDQGTPLKIERLTGLITLGNGTSGTVAQIVSADGSTTSPLYLIQSANSGRRAIQIGVTGDSSNRLNIFADGKVEWGSGSATRDTNLYRSAADTLRTDDSFSVGGSITVTGTVDGRDVSVDGTKLDGIAAGATANSSDATLLNRANHTGTQTASTISDFNTAADARITAQKGIADGIATLDSGGKVPSGQLPSYVDDVIEYANLAGFPVTGTAGLIYVAQDTNKTYRWSGSAYTEISPSEVNSVAGKTGVVTLDKSDVGLANVDNTSDATKNSATATLTNKTLTNPVVTGPGVGTITLRYTNTSNNGGTAELPASTGTYVLATTATTQSFSNKTISGSSNTISNIAQSSVTNLTTDLAGKASLSGAAFVGDITVPDEAYGVGWNGSTEAPTKNAVYDKIETLSAGSGISEALAIAYATAL